jgi:CRISPR/Cas system-associated exonuclease Cas4 (RecB family)
LQNSKIERKSYPWGRAYEVTRENHPKLVLPSVTTILKLITEPKFKPLREKFGEARWQKILDDASFRGTVMHSMLENFLLEYAESKSVEKSLQTAQDTAKTEESNSPDKLQLIKRGRDLFWNFYHEEFWGNIKRVLHNELFLWTDFRGGWAGATDFIYLDFNDLTVVIDFKSSSSPKDEEDILSYKCQISAYMFAYAERYGVIPDRGEIWIANEKDSKLQRFIVTKDEFKTYLRKFLELLLEFREINGI